MRRETRDNLVDFRVTMPKRWRDVYHYDMQGHMIGWTRYGGARADEFTANGELVMERDKAGRPALARAVRYERRTPASFDPKAGLPDLTPLTYVPTGAWVRYSYQNVEDRVGVRSEQGGN